MLGNQVADLWDNPPTRASDQPIDVASPRPGFENRLDVAQVAGYVAPSTVTVSADIGGGVSLGTGVMISEDGEILTNAHVVEGADEVRVRLMGESEPREVTVIAEDHGNKLALLRMSGDGFEAATFADPGSVRLGDDVMAIGFALGLDGEPSVTLGIVSALDRSVGQGDVFLDGLIQSTSDLVGQLGRSARQRRRRSRRDQPCGRPGHGGVHGDQRRIRDLGRRGVPDRRVASGPGDGECVKRRPSVSGWRTAATRAGRDRHQRRAGTPAAEIGVALGDLIVSIDGSVTDGSSALIAAIRDKQPGDTVTVAIVRGTESLELDVVLMARPG